MVVFYSQGAAAAEEEWILIHKHYYSKQQQEQQQEQQPQQSTRTTNSHAKRTKVTFAQPQVSSQHEYPPLTLGEKQKCFYDRRDRYLFEQDRITTANSKAAHKETNYSTLRGLEDLFAAKTKEKSRQEHVHCVLRAAARLKHEGYVAHEVWADTLRYISSEWSAAARQRAAELAREDERVVRQLWL